MPTFKERQEEMARELDALIAKYQHPDNGLEGAFYNRLLETPDPDTNGNHSPGFWLLATLHDRLGTADLVRLVADVLEE